jgi:heptosyltransferase I
MNKILVILPNNLGDVIMALPVLAGLKEKDPASYITFFVEEGFEGGLVNAPYCDRIFIFNRKHIRDLTRASQWQDALPALRSDAVSLAEERFDRVINLSQHPYISYLTAIISCKDTAGRIFLREGNHAIPDAWSQYLYTIPFARSCNNLHATDVYCRIAGVQPPPSGPLIRLHEDERVAARKFLSNRGMSPDTGPLWILQPGAAYAAKRWPLEHFAALGARLTAEGGRIIVTGSPAEMDLASALGEKIGEKAFVTAGKRTFRETIALLPFTQGCITGDTAIMHAAAALLTRVYALFGPTNPVETGPYGPGHKVFYGRCAKRPCFCMECKNTLCMKSIAPEFVYSVIRNEPVRESRCDLFTTALRADRAVGLDAEVCAGPALFDPVAAIIVRAMIGDTALSFDLGTIDKSITGEIAAFAHRLERMIGALSEYLDAKSMDAIRRYEAVHAEHRAPSSLLDFFSALLNIQLNGIPLLDPIAGVRESREVCKNLKAALGLALTAAS